MLNYLLLAVLFSGVTATPLSDALQSVTFLHEGVLNSTDTLFFKGLTPCGYLEAENVSSYLSSWGMGGSCPYLWKTNSSSSNPYTCSAESSITSGYDMPGNDLSTAELPAGSTPATCQALCCSTPGCAAFVYAPSAPSVFESCSQGSICCYMKNSVGPTSPFPSLSSGTVTPGKVPGQTAPGLGMRSAIPLGGLGAGTMELRGDGTFHEVTIHNAHPAAAAKQGVLADALLGLRVDMPGGGGSITIPLRTTPPPYASSSTGPPSRGGLGTMGYSGAYPLTRLHVGEFTPATTASLPTGFQASLFAYAPFTPSREEDMAHPAVIFTLVVTHTSTTTFNASLLLQVPWGAINDCDRTGDGKTAPLLPPFPTPSHLECLSACATPPNGTTGCGAWTWIPSPSGGTCTLTSTPNLSRFRKGYFCGVGGGWVESSGGGVTFLGDAGGVNPSAPALGDVTLRPLGSSDATATTGTAAFVGPTPASVWGALSGGGGGGAALPTLLPNAAGVAGVASTLSLPGMAAGGIAGTGEVSVLWAWHFPHKDWYGAEVGNYYANLWEDSVAVGKELATPGRLTSIAKDIASHLSVVLGPSAGSPLPPSPIPEWLRDTLTNQFSHFRSMHWTRDGRVSFASFVSLPLRIKINQPTQPYTLILTFTLPPPTPPTNFPFIFPFSLRTLR